MHELALVQNMFKILEESAAANNITKITTVKLVVGKLSNALPDALRFGFEALPKGALLAQTRLEIQEEAAEGVCTACGESFTLHGYSLSCPNCGSIQINLMSGQDLYIQSYEGE